MECPLREQQLMLNRRQLLGRSTLGLGTAALAGLLPTEDLAAEGVVADSGGGLHHTAKAKRVIYLFMSGGPSQLDLWDYKPKLKQMFNQQLPEEVRSGQRITGMTANQKDGLPLCPSKYTFTRYDNNDAGVWVSELLPHTARVTKELCVVHSTFTEAINHDPAITYIQTGSQIPGRPSLGAWLSYGLGSMNQDLPHYVVMHAKTSFPEQSLFNRLWGTGFMPSDHQGILMRSQGEPGPVSEQSCRRYQSRPAEPTGCPDRNQSRSVRAVRQPRSIGADQAARNGLPHAGFGARADGLV